jgi:Tol biopolymer transport system component
LHLTGVIAPIGTRTTGSMTATASSPDDRQPTYTMIRPAARRPRDRRQPDRSSLPVLTCLFVSGLLLAGCGGGSRAASGVPATSPKRSGKLVFIQSGHAIMRANANGSNPVWVRVPGLQTEPDLSPDGKRVVYVVWPPANQKNPWQVWVADLDGTHLGRLEPDATRFLTCPRWFSDGSRVVLATEAADGSWELHVDSPSGGVEIVRIPLPNINGLCADPTPDGRRLVVNVDQPGALGQLWEIDVNGSNLHRITTTSHCDAGVPAVDPTGQEIVAPVSCHDPARSGLWIVPLPSGQPRVISDNHASTPAGQAILVGASNWSPDGSWIVYDRERADQQTAAAPVVEVWETRPTGADQHRLLPSNASWPALGP